MTLIPIIRHVQGIVVEADGSFETLIGGGLNDPVYRRGLRRGGRPEQEKYLSDKTPNDLTDGVHNAGDYNECVLLGSAWLSSQTCESAYDASSITATKGLPFELLFSNNSRISATQKQNQSIPT